MAQEMRDSLVFITASERRLRILDRFNEGPVTREELSDLTSDSTASRELEKLHDRDWIGSVDDKTHQFTTIGGHIYRQYEETRKEIDDLSGEPRKHIRDLANSDVRVRILKALYDSPKTKRELAEITSNTSATRARRYFNQEKSWIEPADSSMYALTTDGEQMYEEFSALNNRIEEVNKAQEFLAALQDDNLEIPPDVLAAGKVTAASRTQGYTHLERFREACESDISRFQGILPTTSSLFTSPAEGVLAGGAEMELIIDQGVLETGVESYPDTPGDFADNFSLYIYPDELTVGLAIFDDVLALIAAFDSEGNIQASLRGRNERVVSWATDVYENYREQAKRYPRGSEDRQLERIAARTRSDD